MKKKKKKEEKKTNSNLTYDTFYKSHLSGKLVPFSKKKKKKKKKLERCM